MTKVRMLGVTLSFVVVLAPSTLFAQSTINNSMCSWYRDSALSATEAMTKGDLVHTPSGEYLSNDTLHGRPAPTAKPGCPKGGDRYSTNLVVHASWCAAVNNIDKLADEAITRLQEINGCWSDRSSMCVAYANDAERAKITNQGKSGASCRYSGARYTASFDDNYNWCMSAPLNDVYSEERGRITDMDRCNGCQDYADDVEAARTTAHRRGCDRKLIGPRWSTNRQDHVGWCMNANLSSQDAAKADRWHEANNCTP